MSAIRIYNHLQGSKTTEGYFWKHDIHEINKGSFPSINYESNQPHLMKAELRWAESGQGYNKRLTANSLATWSHTDSSEPVMKWRKNGITIDHHERPKYETSRLHCNAILVTEAVAAGAQCNGGTIHCHCHRHRPHKRIFIEDPNTWK